MTQQERTCASRALIVEGAIREFGQYGYERASINRICTENGISKGRMFHQFKNKEEIFRASVEDCYEGLTAYMQAFAPVPDRTLAENFHSYFQHRQNYFLERPYAPLLMYEVVQHPPAFFKQMSFSIREQFERQNLQLLREIFTHSSQTMDVVDPELALQTFHIASYFIHLHIGYPNWDVHGDMRAVSERSLEMFDNVIHMLLYGVLPRHAGEPEPMPGEGAAAVPMRSIEKTPQGPAGPDLQE